MTDTKKEKRYERLYEQIRSLMDKTPSPNARMATITAILHHKMDYFFWTGFYFIENDEMTVQQYQGPLACQVLAKNLGVCWAAFNKNETIVVPDVHLFPGHIACDSRSNSEIVVPVRNKQNEVIGVLDVDSAEKESFNHIDKKWLEKIVQFIFAKIE